MPISRFFLASSCLLLAATISPSQSASANPAATGAQLANDACGKLLSLQIPGATIAAAKSYEAGAFPAPPPRPGDNGLADFYSKMPAFCRVVATAKPTADSNIVIEIWLPLAGWNGRIEGLGNGGFAGSYDTSGLARFMSKGYAAAATDTGHTGSFIDASWAIGHPEKVADFGYRGIHEMTRVAKLVVAQFYGSAARHSYFVACSDGGREALMEAQRFPYDYDGILA